MIYYLAGCPLSLLFSFIGDSNNRETIFILVSFVGHISSFILPFFSSYAVLCWWRGISGAAVTSILPLYLSILSDMFPVKNRSVASVIATTVTCMGTLIGQAISGFFATRFGWRFFFRIISVLGIGATMSLICLACIDSSPIVVKFPKKGEAEMGHSTPVVRSTEELQEKFKLDLSIFAESLRVPTNWISRIPADELHVVFFQLIPECMPWGVYNVYIQDILHVECGFSLDFVITFIAIHCRLHCLSYSLDWEEVLGV